MAGGFQLFGQSADISGGMCEPAPPGSADRAKPSYGAWQAHRPTRKPALKRMIGLHLIEPRKRAL